MSVAGLPSGVSVSIEPLRSDYRASDGVDVRITYQNTSASPIKFLPWDTALEGEINHDFLSVKSQGLSISYIGKHVKRVRASDSDYLIIEAGAAVSGVVDVSQAYAIHEKGEYSVSYEGFDLDSSSAQFKQNGGSLINLSEDRPIKLLKQPAAIRNCTVGQASAINQALTIAETIAIESRNSLSAAPDYLRPNARRYTEWFGAFSSSNYQLIQTGFNRIADALINRTIGFDCACDIQNRNSVFAFVFPNDPFNMNVCPVFFAVGPSGTDSRSGTIIHEISHFNVVAASDDFQSALNQSGSRALARANPSAAIRNANAFEYFAENTPFLSVPQPADLVISSSVISNTELEVDSLVVVSGAVRNIGNGASEATILTLTLRGATISPQISQVNIPVITPRASSSFQFSASVPSEAGEYTVELCVAEISGESDINNNCETLPILLVSARGIITIAPIIQLLLDD